jgi:hypothetical protein
MEKLAEKKALRQFLQDVRLEAAAGAYGEILLPGGKIVCAALRTENSLQVEAMIDSEGFLTSPGNEAARVTTYYCALGEVEFVYPETISYMDGI